jgi:hypothetical protein
MLAKFLGTSFTYDVLLVQGNKSDTNHLNALNDKAVEDYQISCYSIKSSKFSAEANNQQLHSYYIRAPPLAA